MNPTPIHIAKGDYVQLATGGQIMTVVDAPEGQPVKVCLMKDGRITWDSFPAGDLVRHR